MGPPRPDREPDERRNDQPHLPRARRLDRAPTAIHRLDEPGRPGLQRRAPYTVCVGGRRRRLRERAQAVVGCRQDLDALPGKRNAITCTQPANDLRGSAMARSPRAQLDGVR